MNEADRWGSDGAAILDGVAGVPGATRVGGVYTMTRDAYPSVLTIAPGKILVQDGWRLFIFGTVEE